MKGDIQSKKTENKKIAEIEIENFEDVTKMYHKIRKMFLVVTKGLL